MTPLDLERFRLPPGDRPKPPRRQRPPRHKGREWFLRGPIPGLWLTRAATLPGRTLHVALALWHLAGMARSRVVKATGEAFRRFGVSPHAARRGLAAMERAGLVTAERHSGRRPLVTLLDYPPAPSPEPAGPQRTSNPMPTPRIPQQNSESAGDVASGVAETGPKPPTGGPQN